MIGRDFPQQNLELGPPKGMTADECHVLPVCRATMDGQPVVISCFQPTEEEREAIAAGGPVWLTVLGVTMPPVIVSGRSPFH